MKVLLKKFIAYLRHYFSIEVEKNVSATCGLLFLDKEEGITSCSCEIAWSENLRLA